MDHAVVLFSGGIDSTTALYWARKRFERVSAFTVDYGQRHAIEIEMSRRLASRLGIAQKVVRVDLTQIGGSALTDREIPLPDYRGPEKIEAGPPSTYVPFRNGILLSLAAAWADVTEGRHLVCGFNVIDSPEYPDTRPGFVAAMQAAVNEGTRAAFDGEPCVLHAPFIDKKKSEIIRLGLEMGVDYSYSVSCYAGREVPCASCSSCVLRRKAWEEVGQEDPLIKRLKEEGRA
jgi:7-cyano-7-deazaguanine synthase